jgi:hypothetical protein
MVLVQGALLQRPLNKTFDDRGIIFPPALAPFDAVISHCKNER